MQEKRNKVTIEIMGQEYNMLGQESEEYIHSIALYVDKRMKELSKKRNIMNNTMLAVLTALSITDEFFDLKRELEIAHKEAVKPGKELENVRYQLRKTKEEIASQKTEIENLKEQLSNSQEEASNIYSEWLKAQKDVKELIGKIERLEEQKNQLEMQVGQAKSDEKRLR